MFLDIVRGLGFACGTVARHTAEITAPVVEAFERGYEDGRYPDLEDENRRLAAEILAENARGVLPHPSSTGTRATESKTEIAPAQSKEAAPTSGEPVAA